MQNRQYWLIDGIDTPQTLKVSWREGNHIRYGKTTLEPGKKYDTNGDDVLEKSLMQSTISKVHTKQLKDRLDAAGISYKETKCQSCGGRVKKLEYKIIQFGGD